MSVWLQFIGCALVILFAGSKLSKYGDVIAEKTGMGRTWIGVVLMASVTSLPEVITGISSVAVFDLPDIAAGNVLGSCMFNLLVIALLDFKSGDTPISTQADQAHMLPAAFGVLLLGLVNVSILVTDRMPAIGWFGLSSVFFLLVYLLAMRMTFRITQKVKSQQEVQEQQYEGISTKRAATIYILNALLVIAAASWLPRLGDQIAQMTGLGHTFVGSLFIALTTVLPEVVVSFTALKMGAPDLALGNLFGSSLFNVAVLALDDFIYTKGPLLSHLSGNHMISASGAIVLTSIIMIGMASRPRKKHLGLAWNSIVMIIVFLVVQWLIYLLG